MNPHWAHFEHEADIGVRGCGATPAEAFAQAALALSAIVTDPLTIDPRQQVIVKCQAPDLEILLFDWLNAVIFEMTTRKWLFIRYEVTINNLQLEAVLWGEAVDRARHAPAVEPKGATCTQLRVAPEAGGWCAQCVIDV